MIDQTPDDYWTVAHGQQLNDPIVFRHYEVKDGKIRETETFNLPVKALVDRAKAPVKAFAALTRAKDRLNAMEEAMRNAGIWSSEDEALMQETFASIDAALDHAESQK